jgi:hypothetical protein
MTFPARQASVSGPLLMRLAPGGIVAVKQELAAGPARGDPLKEFQTFGGQLDVADLAGF